MRTLGRLVTVAVVLWAPLTVLSGYGLAAMGAGSLGAAWVFGSCAFCGAFFCPVFALVGAE